jgi:hypothetical protein
MNLFFSAGEHSNRCIIAPSFVHGIARRPPGHLSERLPGHPAAQRGRISYRPSLGPV